MSGITEAAKLQGIQTAYKALFQEALNRKAAEATYTAYTSEEDIDGKYLEFAWLTNDPVMAKWVGKRVYDAMRAEKTSIVAEPYQKGFKESIIDILGDKSGLIAKNIADKLNNPAADKDKLAFAKLITGFADTGYDGVAYFSTAHPNGPAGANQSNTSSDALTRSSFKAARQAMQELSDENGEPLGISPTVLMVGPSNEDMARELCLGQYRLQGISDTGATDPASGIDAAGAVDNVSRGYGIRVVVNPRLKGAYDGHWFLIDDSKGAKPIVMGKLGGDPKAWDTLTCYFNSSCILIIQSKLIMELS